MPRTRIRKTERHVRFGQHEVDEVTRPGGPLPLFVQHVAQGDAGSMFVSLEPSRVRICAPHMNTTGRMSEMDVSEVPAAPRSVPPEQSQALLAGPRRTMRLLVLAWIALFASLGFMAGVSSFVGLSVWSSLNLNEETWFFGLTKSTLILSGCVLPFPVALLLLYVRYTKRVHLLRHGVPAVARVIERASETDAEGHTVHYAEYEFHIKGYRHTGKVFMNLEKVNFMTPHDALVVVYDESDPGKNSWWAPARTGEAVHSASPAFPEEQTGKK